MRTALKNVLPGFMFVPNFTQISFQHIVVEKQKQSQREYGVEILLLISISGRSNQAHISS